MLLETASCSKTEEMNLPVSEPETQVQHLIVTPTRDYEEALAIAQQSIALVDRPATRAQRPRTIRSSRGQCVTVPATRNGESQTDTLMYVFNFEDDNGFAIIAANRAVDPILAVTEKGSYTYGEKTGVENFDFYMDVLTSGLGDVVKPPIFDTMITIPAFKTVEIDEERHCDPLILAQWGQDDVFGAYANNKKAGCAPVAMAQIMSYHQFPTTITTTYPDNGYTQHAGETIEVNWQNLIAFPWYNYRASALLREIGERVHTDYISKSDSSGTSPDMIPRGFRAFGYNCSNYSAFDFASIYSALDEQRPVLLGGDNQISGKGGHAWVADGYKYERKGTEYYELRIIDDGIRQYRDYVLVNSTVTTQKLLHYNWGWFGNANGYFAAKNQCSIDVGEDHFDYQNIIALTSIQKAND